VILLDTHIWLWWVHGDNRMPSEYTKILQEHEASGLCLSTITCWEVAKLVEYQRLILPLPIAEWMQQALAYPGMRLIELSPDIAIESTRLPQPFHRDPADQIIVATARVLNCPLMTVDDKIRHYPHVGLLP
jgi:PIN domain nuclease of toxin-antitoxin system